jgi:hypothetical protein
MAVKLGQSAIPAQTVVHWRTVHAKHSTILSLQQLDSYILGS